jgi:trehalose 6-phosphate phosphatase
MNSIDPPPPAPQRNWAYFLDFDGTLVDIADRPEGVRVKQELVSLLSGIDKVTGDAVVLVSGRPISDLDSYLEPLKLRASGLHGLEYRLDPNGPVVSCGPSPAALDTARSALAAFARRHEGVQIEDKGKSIAVHFRRAPELEAQAQRVTDDALHALGPEFVCLSGKMVFELKPRIAHKGRAVDKFMRFSAFSNRLPVFVGDDVTDEDGFGACNARGGVTVRVGNGNRPTQATFRLRDVEAVEDWLGSLVGPVNGSDL